MQEKKNNKTNSDDECSLSDNLATKYSLIDVIVALLISPENIRIYQKILALIAHEAGYFH